MNTPDILSAVRNSPPAVKSAVLAELLAEAFAKSGGAPVPVPDGRGGTFGYVLKPPPAGPYTPPPLTPEELAELRDRVAHIDRAVSLDDFMKLVDRGVEARLAARLQPAAVEAPTPVGR